MRALPPVSGRPLPGQGRQRPPEPYSASAPRPVEFQGPAEPQIGSQRNFRGPAASAASARKGGCPFSRNTHGNSAAALNA